MRLFKYGFTLLTTILLFQTGKSQDVTTVEASSSDISENLDLEAVASLFGEAEDLEDFEKKLNDPKTQISNLDLNEDGEVDYLRVVEASEKETHVVFVQAVIGEDEYQDVATIDVEKDDKGETQVQVVGDVHMYGPDYVITPVYVAPPVIFVWFWGPLYSPWRSPFYWGYYPPYYRPWAPYPPHVYRSNVHVHVNVHNSYHVTNVRRSNTAVNIQNNHSRNDFARKNPDKSFEKRNNSGAKNKHDLSKRPDSKPSQRPNTGTPSTGKQVQKDWKPSSNPNGGKAPNKVSVPNDRPSNQQKPNSGQHQKPANPQQRQKPTNPQQPKKPATTPSRPVQKPSKPATAPSRPASRPQSRPKSVPRRR